MRPVLTGISLMRKSISFLPHEMPRRNFTKPESVIFLTHYTEYSKQVNSGSKLVYLLKTEPPRMIKPCLWRHSVVVY